MPALQTARNKSGEATREDIARGGFKTLEHAREVSYTVNMVKQALLNFVADLGSGILNFAVSRGAYADQRHIEDELWDQEMRRQRAERDMYEAARAEGFADAERMYRRGSTGAS